MPGMAHLPGPGPIAPAPDLEWSNGRATRAAARSLRVFAEPGSSFAPLIMQKRLAAPGRDPRLEGAPVTTDAPAEQARYGALHEERRSHRRAIDHLEAVPADCADDRVGDARGRDFHP